MGGRLQVQRSAAILWEHRRERSLAMYAKRISLNDADPGLVDAQATLILGKR